MTKLKLDGRYAGVLVGVQGEKIEVRSERAYPPGAPLQLELHVGDSALCLRGKSLGSRRVDETRFALKVRLVSLSRSERESLAELYPR